ncbi:MAG: TPR end-of-group domain-containing protein [Planctomycetota bacterium]|jgi:hypothetical protein
MKKAVYRRILFVAATTFVLSLYPSVKADPNDKNNKQKQCIESDTSSLTTGDKSEQDHQQRSAGSKEDNQLQLVKEQLRGDFYKDSLDNLKWALGIIIAFVLGLIIYTIFKDRKEYEKACENAEKAYEKAEQSRTQAEQSREKAREHELKAHENLASISQLIADKLKEIETKVKEMIDAIKAEAMAGQVELEKKGDEERQKSIKEAERQRKISELFRKGLRANEAKDYETAAESYRKIVEELKEENEFYIYHNWGNALTRLAKSKKGKEAKELFNQAIEKFKKAIEIKKDLCQTYISWGASLVNLAKIKKGPVAKDLLKQAEEKCLKAESLKTGEGAYNLACIYALWGNEDKCKEWLKVGEKAGTLTTRDRAMEDDDLKSIRDKDWFKKLRWKGE